MRYWIVRSLVNGKKVGEIGELTEYHVAVEEAANAIYEASKVHSRCVFRRCNQAYKLPLGAFREARAAQRAFLAGVYEVKLVWDEAEVTGEIG